MTKLIVTVSLAVLAILVMCYFTIKTLFKKNKELKAQNEDLASSVEKLEENIGLFVESISEQMKIKDKEQEISTKICEAETDEEIMAIAADIIRSNNERVRNNSKKSK